MGTGNVERGSRRTHLEHLIEVVLHGSAAETGGNGEIRSLAEDVLRFDTQDLRAVILGGGTGMSTVVGGNSGMADWVDNPFVGLKEEFERLDVVVCTTDDGGSTGELLKHLPMIGIGDLRKSCVSLIRKETLQKTYGLGEDDIPRVLKVIQQVFTARFPRRGADERVLADPLLAVADALREACPNVLAAYLRELGSYLCSTEDGLGLDPSGHCLGNLILTAAVFRAAGGRMDRAPGLEALQSGIDEVCEMVGGVPGRLHAATATPGQLRFRYSNGVEVYGQRKAAVARRGLPVERLMADFVGTPAVSESLCRTIEEADVIIYAPGSVYSSMIPVLQVEPIVEAIRSNRKALKILGANFWVQEGETDISLRNRRREFLVSELIDAYHQNIPGGVERMFDVVVCANLENMPGNVLRNYALEGKRPIHLDRSHVDAMGLQTVESTVFSREHLHLSRVIHHDAQNFARVVRALLFVDRSSEAASSKGIHLNKGEPQRHGTPPDVELRHESPVLCEYLAAIRKKLGEKAFDTDSVRDLLVSLAWENRDMDPSHLDYFEGARVVRASDWGRSREWDNVLGYYDPEDRLIKLHEQVMKKPDQLREDLLVSLGESLLGRYIEARRWVDDPSMKALGGRCYEIRLRPGGERECFLSDEQLCRYLELAGMMRDPRRDLIYRVNINENEGFFPSGLLFGFLYAWYLNNAYGGAIEYEMSILRWPDCTLMPYQVKERARKQALVDFFREEIFGHGR